MGVEECIVFLRWWRENGGVVFENCRCVLFNLKHYPRARVASDTVFITMYNI